MRTDIDRMVERREQRQKDLYYWEPACGGTEEAFKARDGKVYIYLWNKYSGEHRYYCVTDDMFLGLSFDPRIPEYNKSD